MNSQASLHMNNLDVTTPPSKMSLAGKIAIIAGVIAMGLLIFRHLTTDHGGSHGGEVHAPHLWGLGVLPFISMLGCIAILPLLKVSHHWWESNINRLGVALVCGALTLLYYIGVAQIGLGGVLGVLDHAIIAEYIPFIVLLFSLYVISGGINLQGDLAAHPATNTAFLAVGAAIASFIGTTGASMLLIRPLLQTNSERKHVVHTVIFFIFLVSNIGGTLLPIGDPPLFLGYLYGVPFLWTLGLWPQWLVCCALLLVVYYIFDKIMYKKETIRDIRRDETEKKPLRLRGWLNFLWLGGAVLSVALVVPGKPFPLLGFEVFPFLREMLMLGFVVLSLFTTSKAIREDNQFNYAAILEVAALFVGIFIAMQVPIVVLQAYGPMLTENFITNPAMFFWATGTLSAFLDNAPTYVVFFELGKTMELAQGAAVVTVASGVLGAGLLIAVSLGAVFMGAMTYIGNGPNFMVKAIAEQSGIRMPSFFGYMFKYSIPILIPIFLIIMVLFLMPWSPFAA